MKKILNLIFGRFMMIALAIVLQVAWLCLAILQLGVKYTFVNMLIRVIGIIVVLVIVNKWSNPANKLSWTFLILLSPMFGLIVYFLFGRSGLTRWMSRSMDAVNEEVEKVQNRDAQAEKELQAQNQSAWQQSHYIDQWADFPVYQNTDVVYYKCGEEMFPDMLAAVRAAEHFIFLEYFIIEEGYMFETLLDALEERAKAGVDVRLIYDDVGCINTVPPKYYKKLEERGISCVAFNPFRPLISVVMNNRDHRKIFVVDGYVGFTGGINLADEYINRASRFGYWKDTGVRLEGEAVWSLTRMFLEMWHYINKSGEDYSRYLPSVYKKKEFCGEGFVQPYGDSPLDHENVGENIYLNMINKAKRYVYIFTPYLIIDHEMMICLSNAAKSGVDVRIVTPGIPDKKVIFLLTQSYYEPLIESGVRIFQYKPGFLHAKSFICDDEIATVGSVNLDFRSLYLHFECGVWMYKTKAIMQLKQDCMETFEVSEEMTLEFCRKRPLAVRIGQGLLRLFAPLL